MSVKKDNNNSICKEYDGSYGDAVKHSMNFDITKVEAICLPSDLRLVDLDRYHASPRSLKQNVKVLDIPSLAKHWENFSEKQSMAFFSDYPLKLEGVFDYSARDIAEWHDNRVTLKFDYTKAFDEWQSHSDVARPHHDMMLYFDRHISDIHTKEGSASASDFMSMISTLSMKKSINITSTKKIDGGSQVIFTEDIGGKAKENVTIPHQFVCRLRPIEGLDMVIEFDCRLRLIMDERKIKLMYWIVDIEAARREIRESVRLRIVKGMSGVENFKIIDGALE